MSAPDQMASVNGPFRKAALSTVVSTIEPVVAIVFMMESVYLRSGQASVGRRASGFGRWEVDGGRRSVEQRFDSWTYTVSYVRISSYLPIEQKKTHTAQLNHSV